MNVLVEHFGEFVGGFLVTLRLSAFAAAGALILGTFVAAMRISPLPPLRFVGTSYVNIFRNTPLTIVWTFVAFGLPKLGVHMKSYFPFGVIALTVYTAAFVCEAIRAGINSVPTGQAEAARSIGLAFHQTLAYVVLPQSFRATIPPLGSVIIAMVKNSALIGSFGYALDLLARGDALIGGQGESAVWCLLGVAIGYLLITIPLGLFIGRLEHALAVAR
jgi:glutamate transport system permease protein